VSTHTARLRLAEDAERLALGLPGDIAAHARERYGIDLTGRYAGRPIRIPFGKASGQLSMTVRQVEADAAAGLGFVVLKTVIAQDALGTSTMSEWAIHETAMAVEPRASAAGRQGWTVTWKGRGWDRSFADYVTLYRHALAAGAEHGMPVAASVKYHLPPLHQDFKIGEYEHTTRKLAQIGGAETIIEKDFSPTLAGDQRARAQEAILRWLREVPGLIRQMADVTLGLKLMNAMFDDEFQVAMVATACASDAHFLVLFNRLFDAGRKVAYGGWDLSDRNLRVLDSLRRGMEGPSIPRLLPISATGNICSGRMMVEYARRGATSGQLHTFFQLPAESYAARLDSRIASALYTLLYEPHDGLIAAMLDLADRGALQPREGLLHFLDVGDGARSAA
jgi:dihydroorotate dehydrogenase